MSGEELEVLLAAQRHAMDVLTAAEAAAKRVGGEAEVEAVSLVLEQQRIAESLLRGEREDASERVSSGGEASGLLESHRKAAELLAATQKEVADKLSQTKMSAAVDILMAGHREASAILLDAWMQVTEGRTSAANNS